MRPAVHAGRPPCGRALEQHAVVAHRPHPRRCRAPGQPGDVAQRRAGCPAAAGLRPSAAHSRTSRPGRRTGRGRACRTAARPGTARRRGREQPARAVAAMVSITSGPPGRSTRRALAHGGGVVRHVLEDLPGDDDVRAAVGQRHGEDVAAHARSPRARPPAAGRTPTGRRRRAGSPCRRRAVRADPRRTRGRPARRRGARRQARAHRGRAASQCSIAKAPSGLPPVVGQAVVEPHVVAR